jgi:hypothetical protein
MRRRLASFTVLGSVLAVLCAAVAGPVAAAVPAEFGAPSVDVRFGSDVTFEQPVDIGGAIARAELLLTFPGADGPLVVGVRPPSGIGPETLTHRYEAVPGELAPNTMIEGRWRLTGEDGAELVGPPATATYADDRFAWRTRTDGLVRLHWYEGDDAFADRALRIAVDGMARAQDFLGVTETDPVDFFVYASQDDIYAALAPDRENVGGQAHPDIRTLFALIAPSQIDDAWVGVVIPHEITHLVFDTATANPYGYPPKWLNEGVATYLSEGNTPSHQVAVERAVVEGTLIPLDGLVGQFPTSADRFGLAYSQSVAAVDYLALEHGESALTELIAAYGRGMGDDEAFTAAIGMPPSAFDEAWRTDLGAGEPTAHGPVVGPPGPLPVDWGGTVEPGAVPASPAGPAPPGRGSGLVIAGAVVALAVVGGLVVFLRRRPGGSPA